MDFPLQFGPYRSKKSLCRTQVGQKTVSNFAAKTEAPEFFFIKVGLHTSTRNFFSRCCSFATLGMETVIIVKYLSIPPT